MSNDMQKPILATVVALEITAATPGQADIGINTLLMRLRALSHQTSSVQLQARSGGVPGITLVMPPEVMVGSALRRCLAAADDFTRQYPELRVHALAHHGVVFGAQESGQPVYVGSAIRLAHSSLRRLEGSQRLVGSRDFIQQTRAWKTSPLSFRPLPGAAAVEGLQAIDLPEQEASQASLTTDHPDLLEFLTRRLADDVGPFASVLVEGARRVAGSVNALIVELGHEIDDLEARARFSRACQDWLDKHPAA